MDSILTSDELATASCVFAVRDADTFVSPIVAALIARKATATRHPLGMLRFDLGRVHATQLRLHVWPNDEEAYSAEEFTVHAHHWTLLSRVLIGEITNELFRLEDDESSQSALYEVNYAAGKSQLIRSRSGVRALPVTTQTWPAGSMYGLPPSAYHRVSVGATFTATFIAAVDGPPDLRSRVVGPPGYQPASFERSPVSTGASLRVLRTLQRSLGGV